MPRHSTDGNQYRGLLGRCAKGQVHWLDREELPPAQPGPPSLDTRIMLTIDRAEPLFGLGSQVAPTDLQPVFRIHLAPRRTLAP